MSWVNFHCNRKSVTGKFPLPWIFDWFKTGENRLCENWCTISRISYFHYVRQVTPSVFSRGIMFLGRNSNIFQVPIWQDTDCWLLNLAVKLSECASVVSWISSFLLSFSTQIETSSCSNQPWSHQYLWGKILCRRHLFE